MARWLERWHNGNALFALLLPLSAVFYLLSWLRRGAYRFGLLRVWRAPVPVIVVGNISVGGTGKTPLTLALVARLQAAGWRPGIVSRGYGGQADYPCWVDTSALAAVVGDEPLLLARRSQVPVVVDPVRSRAAQYLLAQTDCNIIICDDGLQHLGIARDIEIVVVDGERGFGSGWLLPAGPLRELPARLRTADFCVINGAWQGRGIAPTAAHNAVMALVPGPWQAIGAAVKPTIESALAQTSQTQFSRPPAPGPIHAFAGIGHPPRFFALLQAQGFQPITHAFPDHHAYQASDLCFTPELPLVMTEKDAVKCAGFAPANSWYVPVQAILPESFWQALLQRLSTWRLPHVG